MKKWIESFGCRSRAHCKSCLTDAEWKKRMSEQYIMPEACPFNITRPPEPIPEDYDPKELKRRGCCDKATDSVE